MAYRSGCVVCGSPLVYLEEPEALTCSYCGREFRDTVPCSRGHLVCALCHRMGAEDAIEAYCKISMEERPLALAMELMRHPSMKMHGPEHHFLVPAVLLSALANTRHDPDAKARWLKAARKRADAVKGGFCGFLGDCGAAVGTGICVSVLTGATPLSREEWRLSNLMTATSLQEIALHGGPRCCKRNTFLAVRSAIRFLRSELSLDLPEAAVRCEFSRENEECLHEQCPFFQQNSG